MEYQLLWQVGQFIRPTACSHSLLPWLQLWSCKERAVCQMSCSGSSLCLWLLGCPPATRGLCPGCDRPMTPGQNGAWEQLPLLGALTRLGCSRPCSHFPSHAVERRQRGVGRRTLLLWLQLVPCSPVCWASSEVGREASVAGEPGLESSCCHCGQGCTVPGWKPHASLRLCRVLVRKSAGRDQHTLHL